MKLEPGEKIWVSFGKSKEAGIILEVSPTSASRGFEQCKVELLKVNTLMPGQLLRNVYPKPIPDSRITRRYSSEILAGEEML